MERPSRAAAGRSMDKEATMVGRKWGDVMFTVEERDRLRGRLLARAETDETIVGAAFTGSYAVGEGDRWSDTDLVLAVRGDLAPTLRRWTEWLYDDLGARHHWDLPVGAAVVRVFLLPGWLEIDLTLSVAARAVRRGERGLRCGVRPAHGLHRPAPVGQPDRGGPLPGHRLRRPTGSGPSRHRIAGPPGPGPGGPSAGSGPGGPGGRSAPGRGAEAARGRGLRAGPWAGAEAGPRAGAAAGQGRGLRPAPGGVEATRAGAEARAQAGAEAGPGREG